MDQNFSCNLVALGHKTEENHAHSGLPTPPDWAGDSKYSTLVAREIPSYIIRVKIWYLSNWDILKVEKKILPIFLKILHCKVDGQQFTKFILVTHLYRQFFFITARNSLQIPLQISSVMHTRFGITFSKMLVNLSYLVHIVDGMNNFHLNIRKL